MRYMFSKNASEEYILKIGSDSEKQKLLRYRTQELYMTVWTFVISKSFHGTFFSRKLMMLTNIRQNH